MRTIVAPTLFFFSLFLLLPHLGLGQYVHDQKWIILSFFVAISFLSNLLTEQGLKNNRSQFVEFYLASVVLRFLLCLIFIGIELYRGIQEPLLFVATFFVLYLCYTIFEIRELYRNLRANS